MSLRRAALHALCVALASVLATACAARGFTPPADPGAPLPLFADVLASVTSACSAVQTFTAELSLVGRVGSERVRGRVLAGFMRPDAMRLEGVAPLGAPAFVLASSAGVSTLLLPRDNAVLRDSPPEQVLEALTGVSLRPADLQAVLTGCVTANPRASNGRLHANGWASITTDTGATLYLQRESDTWRLRAARREQWLIDYSAWQGRFPAEVRLRSESARVAVDLSAMISQLEANIDINSSAFSVVVPPSAASISLDELRRSGPLRGQS